MGADVAETTKIDRPPRGREEVPAQLSRLLYAHKVIIGQARGLARRASQLGDEGTNDLVVSEVLRTNELQTWFLSEHLVNVPLVTAEDPSSVATQRIAPDPISDCSEKTRRRRDDPSE